MKLPPGFCDDKLSSLPAPEAQTDQHHPLGAAAFDDLVYREIRSKGWESTWVRWGFIKKAAAAVVVRGLSSPGAPEIFDASYALVYARSPYGKLAPECWPALYFAKKGLLVLAPFGDKIRRLQRSDSAHEETARLIAMTYLTGARRLPKWWAALAKARVEYADVVGPVLVAGALTPQQVAGMVRENLERSDDIGQSATVLLLHALELAQLDHQGAKRAGGLTLGWLRASAALPSIVGDLAK